MVQQTIQPSHALSRGQWNGGGSHRRPDAHALKEDRKDANILWRLESPTPGMVLGHCYWPLSHPLGSCPCSACTHGVSPGSGIRCAPFSVQNSRKNHGPWRPMNPSLQILLCIAVIILVAKLLGALTGRIGLPVVLGELFAGILLGPTLIDIWSLSWFTHATSPDGTSAAAVFRVLAQIGVVLLMFYAGLETDVAMMKNTVAPA